MITHAFTCSGPYAVLIMLGIKRVENRGSRPVAERGRYAVGCSKAFCAAEYGNFLQWASQNLSTEDFERVPAWADVKDWPGKVVGTCECVEICGRDVLVATGMEGQSLFDAARTPRPRAWDEGLAYWWELSEVACFDRPIPCRGNLGMWELPNGCDPSRGRQPDAAEGRARPSLAAQVNAADVLARCVGEKVDGANAFCQVLRRGRSPRPTLSGRQNGRFS